MLRTFYENDMLNHFTITKVTLLEAKRRGGERKG